MAQRNRKTKIVATLGPASSTPEMVEKLYNEGVDVFRLNFSHGVHEDHEKRLKIIRALEDKVGRPIGVFADLQGPKLRLGTFKNGSVDIEKGMRITLDSNPAPGTEQRVCLPHPEVMEVLVEGADVLLDDGKVHLHVTKKGPDFVETEVVAGKKLSDRKGVNLPNVILKSGVITDKDRRDLEAAINMGVDWIALSFVQRPEDIAEGRKLVAGRTKIIAKIEKPSAITHLQQIVDMSDAIMVARGDLGVEIPAEKVPSEQKRIIHVCRQAGKPVIVATQMLESMISAPRPTRAEASDVANAILDGADACMLSGETAVGQYPRETVEMMNRILLKTEQLLRDVPPQPPLVSAVSGVHPITSAVVYGAARVAAQLFASLVVIVTRSGATARVKAKQRDFIPTVAVCESDATLRRMTLFWDITPLPQAPVADPLELRRYIDAWGLEDGCLRPGDRVVFVTGSDLVELAHNVVVVHEVVAPSSDRLPQ